MILEREMLERNLCRDPRIAREMIEGSMVLVNGNIATDPNKIINDSDSITLENKEFQSMGADYWALREIDRKNSIFNEGNDVLCFALSGPELDFLLDRKTEPTAISYGSENIPDCVKTIVGNPVLHDLSGEIGTKFNVIAMGLNLGLFQLLGLLEKYMEYLMPNGTVLMKIDNGVGDIDGLKDTASSMAQNLGLSLSAIATSRFNKKVWAIFSTSREEKCTSFV